MSESLPEEPNNQAQMHTRVVIKDDGRKLYSYTFGAEPDPFQASDGRSVAEVQPAPTATAGTGGHV